MAAMWALLSRGGIVMIPLLLTSITGMAVIIERALFLRRRRIIKPGLIGLIERAGTFRDIRELKKSLGDEDGPFVNIIRTGLSHYGQSGDEIKSAMLDQGRQEARVLERGLVVLETVAGIAPLLGLLGTVLGMIKVFDVISVQGLGQTQSLSGGISEALLTTVVGLSIAIPALIFYNYFTHKVDDLILEIEKHSGELIEKLETSHVAER